MSKRRRSRPARHLVVDATALCATAAGPSASALFERLDSLRGRHPGAATTVILDAATLHRVPAADRSRLDAAILAGSLVCPPAGCRGGTVAFAAAVCERLGAVTSVSAGRFRALGDAHLHANRLRLAPAH